MPEKKSSGSTETTLSFEKETKNTFKFSTKDLTAPFDTLYVKKSAFPTRPDEIVVTVAQK